MTDMERKGEMPTGRMEEATPTGKTRTPDMKGAGERFRATAKRAPMESTGEKPPEGKMPGEKEMIHTGHPGKMPGE